MSDWLLRALEELSSNPYLQGTVAGLSTFILEDPTTVTCGLLVADGRMLFLTALVGLTLGIAIGDLGLYAVGRFMGPRTVAWGWLSQDRLNRVKRWFDRNLVFAVLLSRFVPGTRLPTYVGAGIFQASVTRFMGAALFASLIWTFVLLSVTVKLGEAVSSVPGRYRWPIAIAAIVLLVIAQRRAANKLRDTEPEPPVSVFEFWPPFVFYFPVGLYYAWLTIRHWGVTLPTAANPSIYSGGLIRESKSQILSLVPESQQRWIAPYCLYLRPSDGDEAVRGARERIEEAGLSYPLVAKPEMGQRGAGVQRIYSDADLRAYLAAFPPDLGIVFQQLVEYPNEAGVLYYRYPGSDTGHILSITLKEFPFMVGDGARSLRELILADPRARILQHVYFPRHADRLDAIVPAGERLPLVFAGNHAQGTIFKDGCHLASEKLLERLHAIAGSMPDFYFGRFDIRFRDLETFLDGENLQIVEINGAGAESTHIWDARMTLGGAYSALFTQWRILFEIGAANRVRGVKPMGAFQLLRDCWWYRQSSRGYPLAH